MIFFQNGPSWGSDFCSKNGQKYWYLQCFVTKVGLSLFFCSESMESRRPEPKGGFDHSGCLAAATPPGGGGPLGAVWGQGFADFGSAEISQTGRRFKLTDEPWSYSKLVNNRVSDSEVCCPSQQWEPPGKVFGFCSTCPTKNVFRFSHLFRFRF